MRLQDVPVDPTDTAQRVREVMSRPEFSYDKSILERIGEWVSEQLEKLLGPLQPAGGAGAAFGGGAGALIAWLIIIVAAVAVIGTVAYVVLHRVRRPAEEEEVTLESEIEHRNPATYWATEAERHEAAGEWKAALRCRYRELVRTLVDRRQLPDIAGRTTGELRRDLRRTTPAAEDRFDRMSMLFELAWYADQPTGERENAEVRSLLREVLDEPAERRFDATGHLRSSEAAELVEVGR